MKSSHDYIMDLTRLEGVGTEYAVAKLLEVETTVIYRYRKYGRTFGPKLAMRIAELLDVDPMEIIAACEHEKAKSEEERAMWSRAWRKFQSVAAGVSIVMLSTALLSSPSKSEASVLDKYQDEQYILCKVD